MSKMIQEDWEYVDAHERLLIEADDWEEVTAWERLRQTKGVARQMRAHFQELMDVLEQRTEPRDPHVYAIIKRGLDQADRIIKSIEEE